jgi:DNA polymerase III sliding clamp (beta) subunit (PCNA family)
VRGGLQLGRIKRKEKKVNTIERETTTLQTLTAKSADIADLLTGATTAADKGKNAIDSLAAVYLSATGGTITAAASDRYRLIAGELAGEGEGELSPSAIRIGDLKNILAAIKSEKVSREITFTRAGDSLSVAIGGTSLTIQLGTGVFPPYKHLIPSESVAIGEISFNPAYMADFAKVPTSNKAGAMITMEFSGERKPIKVTIPHDSIKWEALLMPMRVNK